MTTKRTRRTREELRDLMLEAGRSVLFDLDPTLGFESLTYSTVFDRLQKDYNQKVTIGSVHERLWESQREFQLDVVAAALRDPITTAANQSFSIAAEIMGTLDLSSPASRRYALQTAIRLTSRQLHTHVEPDLIRLTHSVRFRLWEMGVDHPEAAGFAEAIRKIRSDSNAAYVNVIKAIMKFIGVRVRSDAGDPEQAIVDIALLGNASLLGLETDLLPQAKTSRLLPTGPNGEEEAWFPDSIALWAYVRSMTELDGPELTDNERRL